MLAQTVGQFFRTGGRDEEIVVDIKVGAVYRRQGPGNVVETARVIDVGPDAMGIPHVRYEVLVEQSRVRHNHFAANRTLNLQSFRDLFAEAVEVFDA